MENVRVVIENRYFQNMIFLNILFKKFFTCFFLLYYFLFENEKEDSVLLRFC